MLTTSSALGTCQPHPLSLPVLVLLFHVQRVHLFLEHLMHTRKAFLYVCSCYLVQ